MHNHCRRTLKDFPGVLRPGTVRDFIERNRSRLFRGMGQRDKGFVAGLRMSHEEETGRRLATTAGTSPARQRRPPRPENSPCHRVHWIERGRRATVSSLATRNGCSVPQQSSLCSAGFARMRTDRDYIHLIGLPRSSRTIWSTNVTLRGHLYRDRYSRQNRMTSRSSGLAPGSQTTRA